MNIESLSNDEIMGELRRLQAAARDSETELFLWLWDIESKREDFWKQAGIVSFVGWLTTHQVCEPMQYTEFAAGMKKLGQDYDEARRLGVDLVREMRSYEHEQIRPDDLKMLQGLTQSFEHVHDRKPGEQTSKDWVKRINPKMPRVTGVASKLHKLEAELQQARAELRAVTKERNELKRENEKLRRQLEKKAA